MRFSAVLVFLLSWHTATASWFSTSSGSGDDCANEDIYAIMGVEKDANEATIIKAYRSLARKWHPDRNRGSEKEAEATFAKIAEAYEILLDEEKREVFDRLGRDGLSRLRDGDPTVKKGYLPPDEVLRRVHNDGPEPWQQWLISSSFAYLESFSAQARENLRFLPILLGIDTEFPEVYISATDAKGQSLSSSTSTAGAVTFMFKLTGKSTDFSLSTVHHNCDSPRFLGMKNTYYLECPHVPGLNIAVRVRAKVFHVVGRREGNAASKTFLLDMV